MADAGATVGVSWDRKSQGGAGGTPFLFIPGVYANMLRAILIILCSLASSFVHAECNEGRLGAVYEWTVKPEDGPEQTRVFTLWRSGNQAAHQFSETGITELWERMSNGRTRLVRYFDGRKRGIEYSAAETGLDNDADWQKKYQLLPQAFLESMDPGAESGLGCGLKHSYSRKDGNILIQLTWLKNLGLVETYALRKPGLVVNWTLKRVEDEPAKINAIFQSRENYQLTDFADIGDNESDPFLLNFVHLGHKPNNRVHGHAH